MADKYVKLDDIIETLEHEWGYEGMREDLEKLPTADVEERKQGYWKEHYAFGCWHYDCPFCDDGYVTKEKDETPPNYCGNCGAKMDGGKADGR